MVDERKIYNISKHVMPGTLDGKDIHIHIEFKNKKLSITGDCALSGGQINSTLRGHLEEIKFPVPIPGDGGRTWNKAKLKKLLDVWDKWHLNYMRAGCEHQRAEKWEDKRIDPADLPNSHAYRDEMGIYAIQVYPTEHKDGLLTKPCLTCGYGYGSKWLHEDVPNSILLWLDGLEATVLDGDSSYEHKANTFLKKTGTTIKVEYLRTAKHFDDDVYPRDIYNITISRGDRSFTIEFGNSYKASGRWWKYGNYKRGTYMGVGKNFSKPPLMDEWDKNKNFKVPTAYDVLAAIQKYHPGSLENFCSEMGYDADSKKAEKIYTAVIEEATNVERLFSSKEIEELQDIQ